MTPMPPRMTPGFGLSAAAAELARRHRAMAGPYVLGTNPLLANQQARESSARSYPRRIPLALRQGAGIYLEDVEGRVFIDCLAGAGTLALGHNHPVITEAIQAVLDSGAPLHTLDLTTPTKDRFMADLFDMLPAGMAADAKVQFCSPSGSDAIEAAMKLVRIATGRAGMVAFSGAYHGMTQGALAMMGSLGPKRALHGIPQNVQFAPYPYDYRCPFGLGGQAGVRAGLHYLETLLSDPESGVPTPAGVVVEPVQGEGGVIPAPDAWLRGLRDATARHDVPLIVDEVQTGFGRTGRMFAIEHAGVTPDVLVLSKAIGGALPLSVVVYRGGLDAWKPGAHAGTFRGNQLAMAAGSAAMRFIRDEGLPQHAADMGERLAAHLRALREDVPALGDVRGRGLMLGVEIVQADARGADGPPAAAPELAQRLQALCLRHGLILELGGRHGSVVRFLPPLIIDASQIDDVARIFGHCVRQACGPIVKDTKEPAVPM